MIRIDDKNISQKESISVGVFYEKIKEKFNLKPVDKKTGFERLIKERNLHRPGMALCGYLELFSFNRIQVFGNTEMRYLIGLNSEERYEAIEKIFGYEIPCVIITNSNKPPEEMRILAKKHQISIFCTPYTTTKLIYFIGDFLDDHFSPRLTLHGSFVDVYGVGMLFIGKSGIGKSEVALDLVERGHRLVADDVVIYTKKGEGILMGAGTQLVKHFMEVRGIGIIDVKSMFGVRAIRFQKRLEVVIELEIWNENATYTRTGLDDSFISLLDVEIPYVKLPIIPGKNITVISEVIALHYLLKHYGYDAAKVMKKRLSQKIKDNSNGVDRAIDYFEHDFE